MLDIAYTHSGRLAKADYGTKSETLRQTYEYDKKGQLLAVKDDAGNAVESYAYDKAGNMLSKSILRSGRAGAPRTPQSADYITTTFTFDDANQLVSSTTDGVTTRYAYDAAGRMIREGSKTYRYGYLDKVMSVTDNGSTYTYDYHADGQLASANYGDSSESFAWDGLALIQRGDEQFINEPHVGGGNPVASSKGTSYFNDMLGTTVGSKKDGKYSPAVLSAFGENHLTTQPPNRQTFFTGKPYVEGLGHAFLFRNYRASLAKWQTADPMGYPDGWNQLAYCGNAAIMKVDYLGCESWDYYESRNREVDDAWAGYRNRAQFFGQTPIRIEAGAGILVEKHVLLHEAYRGIGVIDGKEYKIYQQYYYDVYGRDVYACDDPIGTIRSWLTGSGIILGAAGVVISVSGVGAAAIAAGVVVSVGGIAITVIDEVAAVFAKHNLLGVYYYTPIDSMTIEYRKELKE